MSRPGRNELCSCGSKKKYKRCCGSKTGGVSPSLIVLLIAAFVIGAFAVALSNARSTTGAGRVWSAEHGHYHDASGREIPR